MYSTYGAIRSADDCVVDVGIEGDMEVELFAWFGMFAGWVSQKPASHGSASSSVVSVDLLSSQKLRVEVEGVVLPLEEVEEVVLLLEEVLLLLPLEEVEEEGVLQVQSSQQVQWW